MVERRGGGGGAGVGVGVFDRGLACSGTLEKPGGSFCAVRMGGTVLFRGAGAAGGATGEAETGVVVAFRRGAGGAGSERREGSMGALRDTPYSALALPNGPLPPAPADKAKGNEPRTVGCKTGALRGWRLGSTGGVPSRRGREAASSISIKEVERVLLDGVEDTLWDWFPPSKRERLSVFFSLNWL